MGMFDTIKDKLFCPFCGKLQKEGDFQTKDIACMLDSWIIKEIIQHCKDAENIRIYHLCRDCKKWIELNLDLRRLEEEQKSKNSGVPKIKKK